MSEIIIRDATREDISTIHALAWRIFPYTYREILTPEQTEYMMEWMYSEANLATQMDQGHQYLLAYEGTEPVGYVSIEREEEDLFHLQKIYVLPDCQGTGIGKRLFDAAIALIKRQHPTPCAMELNVNRHNRAVGFYQRMGMHIDRSGDFDIGNGFYMNDYIMRMEIYSLEAGSHHLLA